MAKKINMKTLAIIFIVLLSLVIFKTVYDNNRGEKTFKSDIATIDTANVTNITFFPKAEKKGISLKKSANTWQLLANGKTYKPDINIIQNILSSIAVIKAERVAGTDKSQWQNFEVSDTSGTKMIIEVSGKVVSELIIGKFSYKQTGGGFSISTYIRPVGEETTYSVQSQLTMLINRDLNAFRDKTISKIEKENLSSISFSYPGDSSFTLSKTENGWLVNNEATDSNSIQSYLNTIANCSGYEFDDNATNTTLTPVYKIKAQGNNMQTVEINAIPSDSLKQFIITSSQNEGINFISGKSKLADKIFISKKNLMVGKK